MNADRGMPLELEARLAAVRESSADWTTSSWTTARSAQVFARTLQRREARERRARLVRRASFVAAATSLLVLLVLHGTNTGASEAESASAELDAALGAPVQIAARDSSDAGFGRD